MSNPNYPFGRNWRGGIVVAVIILAVAIVAHALTAQLGKVWGWWG